MAQNPDRKTTTPQGKVMKQLGWIVDSYPQRPSRRSVWLRSGPMVTMRVRNVALGLYQHGWRSSFYRPDTTYDAVIIVKAFTEPILREVRRLKALHTPVIFDANVNYYFIWGDYPDSQSQPTQAHRRAALEITRQADHVIADSEYLRDVVREFNPRVTWIPDNVLTSVFRPASPRSEIGKLRLIWSGMAAKSNELLLIRDNLLRHDGLELWLVSEKRPPFIDHLPPRLNARWFRYADLYYAWLLGRADAIISPRTLNNGYNLGHTEYKISLGMARCLPAIASPQPAYVTALSEGGGFVCDTPEAWDTALQHLRDDGDLRQRMGKTARKTVEQRYATSVIAAQMAALLQKMIRERD